ncbi:hypothetical protein LK10_05985 [Sinomonas humi]|uniref:Uncharacterized protein n=1 Tax=Sinomonas humi TaxID=1338436 RepID=A0A0B2AQN7_9MICC|nr:hypothetical protein LK10_05985 [Sinomonas humi]
MRALGRQGIARETLAEWTMGGPGEGPRRDSRERTALGEPTGGRVQLRHDLGGHEVDIFRSWPLMGDRFRRVQDAHWRKLPYWVFIPVGLGLGLAVVLVWFHPRDSPAWGVGGSLGCQVLSLALTAVFWGRRQAQLARDPLGAESPTFA